MKFREYLGEKNGFSWVLVGITNKGEEKVISSFRNEKAATEMQSKYNEFTTEPTTVRKR